ncbi:MAG: RNA polymerase sigma factor [Armatimonadota bacterium]
MQDARISKLVERSLRGDRDPFGAPVAEHRHRVFGFACHMLGDREQAPDAAQETFVKAWVGLDGFDRRRRFEPWLFAIAANVCTDMLRRRRPALSLDADEAADQPAPRDASPESALEDQDLARALRGLSEIEHMTLLLKHVRGFTYEEIAQVTGLRIGTLKSHAHRGRRKLAQLLAGAGSEDDDGLQTG